MYGFFITATNTERGKTLVTAGLRLWLQQQGLRCLAMKPVQSGMQASQLAPDLYQIYAAGCEPQPSEEQVYADLGGLLPWLQPFCYQEPCSPHLAAERQGAPFADPEHIRRCAHELHTRHCDVLLAEGAGGLLVPIDRRRTVADIAQALGLRLILVAQSGLGAINDTLLSLEAIQQRGLPLAGFLLNDLEAHAPAYIRKDNPSIIAQLSGAPYLGTLPHLSSPHHQLRTAFAGLQGLEQLRPYLPTVRASHTVP